MVRVTFCREGTPSQMRHWGPASTSAVHGHGLWLIWYIHKPQSKDIRTPLKPRYVQYQYMYPLGLLLDNIDVSSWSPRPKRDRGPASGASGASQALIFWLLEGDIDGCKDVEVDVDVDVDAGILAV